MGSRDGIVSFVIGAGAGALVGLGLWWFASRQLEKGFREGQGELARQVGMGEDQLRARLEQGRTELRSQIASQVPPLVRTTMRDQLAQYGITPERGAQLQRVLDAAARMGLVS